jgi:hypothetical protein
LSKYLLKNCTCTGPSSRWKYICSSAVISLSSHKPTTNPSAYVFAEFKVLVSAAACAVETGLFASEVLSTLFINNEVLAVPTTKFKVPPSHCLSKAVFQVAALVILASAKVPAQPTVIVVAAKAINGEPPRVLYLCHPL